MKVIYTYTLICICIYLCACTFFFCQIPYCLTKIWDLVEGALQESLKGWTWHCYIHLYFLHKNPLAPGGYLVHFSRTSAEASATEALVGSFISRGAAGVFQVAKV